MMDFIYNFIDNYGLIAIFIIVMLEYACFPMPSEVVLPIAGAFCMSFNYHFLYVLALCTFAGLLGSLICYTIGYYGGTTLIWKVQRKYPKSKKAIDDSFEKYNKYANFSVCVGRIIPLCRTYISFIAGSSRQSLFKYILFSLIGISFWNLVLIYLGYAFYNNIEIISTFYDKYKIIIFLLVGLFLVIYIIKRLLKGKNNRKEMIKKRPNN